MAVPTEKKSLYKPRKVFPTLTDLKSHFQISKTMIKGNCNIAVTEEIEPQEKRVLLYSLTSVCKEKTLHFCSLFDQQVILIPRVLEKSSPVSKIKQVSLAINFLLPKTIQF